MLNIFSVLLLCHVATDFLFQTKFIYKAKQNSSLGLWLHSGIFLILSLIMLFPLTCKNFWFLAWLLVPFISHVFLDQMKMNLGRSLIKPELFFFLLDQILHVVFIASYLLFPAFRELDISLSIANLMPHFLRIDVTIFYLIVAFNIYASYAVGVVLYYYDRTINSGVKELKYNYGGMLYRALFFTLAVTSNYVLSLLLAVFNYSMSRMLLMYDKRRFRIETISLLFLISIFVIIILIKRI